MRRVLILLMVVLIGLAMVACSGKETVITKTVEVTVPVDRIIEKRVEVPVVTEVSTGISQAMYDQSVADTNTAKANTATANAKITSLQADLNTANGKVTTLQTQVDALKVKYGSPVTPQRFEGTGEITTAPFTTTSGEWVIWWTYVTSSPRYASFSIYVYDRNNPNGAYKAKLDSGDRLGTSEEGESHIYLPPGEYFIRVIEANTLGWIIHVDPA